MLHLCVSVRQLPYERLFLRYVYEKNTLRLPEGLIGPVKMVFLDLDGTALNHEKELSANTLQALNLLKLHGIPFTFASARPAAMMGLYCQKANVSGPIIASEGAEIRIWGNRQYDLPVSYRRKRGSCSDGILS